jgi:hypothetical protein
MVTGERENQPAALPPVRSEPMLADPIEDLFDLLNESGMTLVFWVCPNGCRGQVKWNDDKTDAVCMVCGRAKSANNDLRRGTPSPRNAGSEAP